MAGTILLSLVTFYLLAILAAGLLLSRRIKGTDDYMVAGRRLGRLVLTGTLLATWTGAGTIVGRANFAYQYGPLASIIYAAGAPIGVLIIYFFVAGKIRGLGKYTVPQILGTHYGRLVQALAAVPILLAYLAITSQQFITLGYILNLTVGLPTDTGTVIGAGVIVFLAVAGGLISVAYTDAVTALVIAIGLFTSLIFVMLSIGGLGGLFENLPAMKTTWNAGFTPVQLLGFFLPTLILFLGDQNMYQRFSSASSPEVARRSALGLFWGDVLFYSMVTLLASSAAILLPRIEPDKAILALATDYLPLVFGGLILVAATGFAITTGSSFILSAGGNLVFDLYRTISGKEHGSRTYLVMTRVTVALLGLGALATGTLFPSVLDIQLYSYTIYGAAITPSLLAIFFWPRATKVGALGSLITGVVATLFWEITQPLDWNSVLFSLPLSVVVLVVLSLMTRPLSAEARQSERSLP